MTRVLLQQVGGTVTLGTRPDGTPTFRVKPKMRAWRSTCCLQPECSHLPDEVIAVAVLTSDGERLDGG